MEHRLLHITVWKNEALNPKTSEEILAGTRKIEYREIKVYWEKRLAQYKAPFPLRLINGMKKDAPELTVEVVKVARDTPLQ